VIYVNLGVLSRQRGEYDKALEYYHQALRVKEELGDVAGTANIYNNLTANYHERGDFGAALDYCRKSIEIYERIDDYSGLALGMMNLGCIYVDQGNYTEAQAAFQQSLAVCEEREYEDVRAYNLVNLAELELQRGEIEEAENYALGALEQAKSLRMKHTVGLALRKLGTIRARRRAWAEAWQAFEESKRMFEAVGSATERARTALEFGVALVAKGDNEGARRLLNETKATFLRLGLHQEAEKAAEVLRDLSA